MVNSRNKRAASDNTFKPTKTATCQRDPYKLRSLEENASTNFFFNFGSYFSDNVSTLPPLASSEGDNTKVYHSPYRLEEPLPAPGSRKN